MPDSHARRPLRRSGFNCAVLAELSISQWKAAEIRTRADSCIIAIALIEKCGTAICGFPRQLAAIRKHASAQGVRIARIFREEGVSGTKDLDHRPALQELLVALHSNGTRLVLVEKLDRLARDLMIQESIIADLKRSGF